MHVRLTDSTMRMAGDLARRGAVEGTSVVARAQWGGRGRHGRVWASPASAGLYITCVLRPPAGREAAQLALVAGYAAWRTAGLLGARGVCLKWPNDVVTRGGRKLAGVLLQREDGAVLVGIGINVVAAADARAGRGGSALPRRYIGLRDLCGSLPVGDAGRLAVLYALLPVLAHAYRRWCDAGLGFVCRAWPAADALQGAQVTAQGRSGALRGRADGLADDGRLRLRTDAGLQLIDGGEVHTLRPARRHCGGRGGVERLY